MYADSVIFCHSIVCQPGVPSYDPRSCSATMSPVV